MAPSWPAIVLSSAAMLLYEPGLLPPSLLYLSTLALIRFDWRALKGTA